MIFEVNNVREEFGTIQNRAASQPTLGEEEPTELLAIEQPRLIVTESTNGVPVEAVCSKCLNVSFYVGLTQPTLEAHLDVLKALFEGHLWSVHSPAPCPRH